MTYVSAFEKLAEFAELSEDAQELARNADLSSGDWYSPAEASYDFLWAACMVLRSYESPSWGNTGGRYGHSVGMGAELDVDWLAGLSEDELEEWIEYQEDYAREFLGDPWAAWTFAKHADKHGERTLLELADWLSMMIGKYGTE